MGRSSIHKFSNCDFGCFFFLVPLVVFFYVFIGDVDLIGDLPIGDVAIGEVALGLVLPLKV